MDIYNFFTAAYGYTRNYKGVPVWLLTPIRRVIRKMAAKYLPKYFSRVPANINKPREERVVVSLTSFPFLLKIVNAGIVVNLVLFAFNLFPLPPMDGGRIMLSLLPPHLAAGFAKVERYGFFILMGLIYLGVTTYWMRPVMMLGRWLINLFLYPLLYFLGLS